MSGFGVNSRRDLPCAVERQGRTYLSHSLTISRMLRMALRLVPVRFDGNGKGAVV